eukprot:GHVR01023280.1.p1 GENE.GHVR01023280.1~~GHVR01023280.1.p1  ORF type:complete len:120 (+),score=60.10 GHVR01023280.1:52-411(+)
MQVFTHTHTQTPTHTHTHPQPYAMRYDHTVKPTATLTGEGGGRAALWTPEFKFHEERGEGRQHYPVYTAEEERCLESQRKVAEEESIRREWRTHEASLRDGVGVHPSLPSDNVPLKPSQ